MLDQNDFKQISTVVKENIEENNKKLTKEIVGQVMVGVGEFITENVLTAIDDVEERLSKRLGALETKMNTLGTKMNTLPDKDDLDRVAADVKGTIVAKLRTEDDKVNLLIKFLKEGNVLTEEQWKALRAFHVFPSIEI